MIWMTWRQFRVQAYAASAVVALLAVSLAAAGSATTSDDTLLSLLNLGLLLVPALIGVFWGAPLVARELEAGTHRLVWNQSVTRTRWLTAKLVLVGGAAAAVVGLLSLLLTNWAAQVDGVRLDLLSPLVFPARGTVPVGQAVLSFIIGVTAGIVIRRMVPAMAVTLAASLAAQLPMPLWLRPRLVTPVTEVMPLDLDKLEGLPFGPDGVIGVYLAPGKPGALILSNETVMADGGAFPTPLHAPRCTDIGRSMQDCYSFLGSLDLHQVVTYQPLSRFWTLQVYETSILLAVALSLSAFSYWWLRRRTV